MRLPALRRRAAAAPLPTRWASWGRANAAAAVAIVLIVTPTRAVAQQAGPAADLPTAQECAVALERARISDTIAAYDRFLRDFIDCDNWERGFDEQRALADAREDGQAPAEPSDEFAPALPDDRSDDFGPDLALEPPRFEDEVPFDENPPAGAGPAPSETFAEPAPAIDPRGGRSDPLLNLFSANLLDPRAAVEIGADVRRWQVARIDAELVVGGAGLYREEASRRAAVPQDEIVYERSFSDAFVYSGRLEPGSGLGFYILALREGPDAAVLTLTFPLARGGMADPTTQNRITRIACSARFGGAALPCAR